MIFSAQEIQLSILLAGLGWIIQNTYLGNKGLHGLRGTARPGSCLGSLIAAPLVAVGPVSLRALLLGLLEVLLQTALQVADLLHQALLELVLADGLWRLLIFSCPAIGSLRSSWLAQTFVSCSAGNFLLLFEVLERLVNLVLVTALRLIGLLDEIR